MRGMNVRCGRDGLCGERTVREVGASDARGSGVGAGDDLLGVRGGHPELGHAQVGREGGSGEQHRSPRVGEIIVVDLLGSDLLKGTGGATVAKTAKCVIIGIWNKEALMSNGLNQNGGDCSMQVEDMAELLRDKGF